MNEELKGHALFVLRNAFKKSIAHQLPPSNLLPPSVQAEKEAIEFEKKLIDFDQRIKRGFELILAKLK